MNEFEKHRSEWKEQTHTHAQAHSIAYAWMYEIVDYEK